jgi:hypothetical protein
MNFFTRFEPINPAAPIIITDLIFYDSVYFFNYDISFLIEYHTRLNRQFEQKYNYYSNYVL